MIINFLLIIQENMKRVFIKIILFISIGIFIGLFLQQIFLPKWYYPDNTLPESATRTIAGFYEEENNSLDVLMLGTSSVICGISPMELYESYGVTSYNLGTPSQPIQISYYLLEAAFKTQAPELVVLDVSSLYKDDSENEIPWRYVLDSMPLNTSKVKLAKEFAKQSANNSYLGAIMPLYRYHDRWKTLTERDFTDFNRNKHYYCKGYYICSMNYAASISEESMNDEVSQLIEQDNRVLYEYNKGEYNVTTEEMERYNASIPKENLIWLFRINQLCKEHNARLLAIKVPIVNSPIWYERAWTQERFKKVKSVCERYNISYIDLQYDADLDINWVFDTRDGGLHLNLFGAQRVTNYLGEFITSHYEISASNNSKWDKDLITYQKVRNVALLELEQNFINYINMISGEFDNMTVFISVSDDMHAGLSSEEMCALRSLGLQTDFNNSYQNSFLAVIENGEVTYESLSNFKLSHSGKLQNADVSYYLESAGHYAKSNSSIEIGGKEYSMNGKGINIVVYDDERNIVLDSAYFDTWKENHRGYHNNENIKNYLREFENYMIEVEDR